MHFNVVSRSVRRVFERRVLSEKVCGCWDNGGEVLCFCELQTYNCAKTSSFPSKNRKSGIWVFRDVRRFTELVVKIAAKCRTKYYLESTWLRR